MNNRTDELAQRRQAALVGGGEKRIAQQHQKGKLTARERLQLLFDDGSFEEIGMLVVHRTTEFGMDAQKYYGDGVVTGYGTIDGRMVFLQAQTINQIRAPKPLAAVMKRNTGQRKFLPVFFRR